MKEDFKLFFISDAHFGCCSLNEEKRKRVEFERFSEAKLSNGDYLFILGDLFDFWFEYRNLIPKDCFGILTVLSNIVKKGVNVYYIAGNHDYWDNGFLEREIGIKYFNEDLTVKLLSKTFYLHHGDGIDKSDKGYLRLKKILRNKICIKLYRLFHPDIGTFVAKRFSKTSRLNSESHKKPVYEYYYEFSEKKFNEGIDYVIMGHTHIPEFKRLGEKFFINVGDWIEHFTYGVYDGREFKIEKWM